MTKRVYARPVLRRQYMGFANKFQQFSIPEPIHNIDSAPIENLVEQFGSPLFVFSETALRQKIQELNQAFQSRYPHFQAAWSYKTNYLNAICKVFHSEGSWAEVVSGFEYRKARTNGIPGNKILFNGPFKPLPVLNQALEEGAHVHADHLDEINDIIKIAKQNNKNYSIALRINMDTGMYPSWDRFGFNLESGQAWEAARRIASTNGEVRLTGIHAHIGTFVTDTAPYKRAAQKMSQFFLRCKKELRQPMSYLDLGGGFPSRNRLKSQYQSTALIPSFDDFAAVITSAIYDTFENEDLPHLFLETGRALVDEAGYLVTTIVGNKSMPSGQRALLLDAGVNFLYTTSWYDLKILPIKHYTGAWEEVSLFGPLCMNIDRIRDIVLLPNLQRGEKLALWPVGAYNVTQWMQFIEMRPAIVLVETNGSAHIIRKPESLDDLLSKEIY